MRWKSVPIECKARSVANQAHITGPIIPSAPRAAPYLAAALVNPACATCTMQSAKPCYLKQEFNKRRQMSETSMISQILGKRLVYLR